MTTPSKKTGKAAIYETARRNSSDFQSVKFEMENALSIAWNSSAPIAKALQDSLFPAGKPDPEEFISAISSLLIDYSGKNSPF